MAVKKETVKKEEVVPVKDKRDDEIELLKLEMTYAYKRLKLWRKFGKKHGPVSSDNDLNNILAELREMGEI
jgi:hypothetical protein